MSDTIKPIHTLLNDIQNIFLQKEAEIKATNRYAALNFTPFRFIDSGEVQITHLLAFFLEKQGDHGQDSIFLEAFIDALNKINPKLYTPTHNYKIQAERRHDGLRQIDLLLRAPGNKFGICIENKLYAADQLNQLSDYNQYLIREFGHNNYLILYLTPEPRLPSYQSIDEGELIDLVNKGQYLNITYQDFILPLLDKWVQIAFPEKIKKFLLDFRYQLERKLNFTSTAPTAKMHQDEIAEYLLSNPSLLRAAYEVPGSLEVAQKLLKNSFANYIKEISEQLNLHIESTPEDFKGFADFWPETPCKLSKPEWGPYGIGLEFTGETLDIGVIGGGKNSSAAAALSQRLGKSHSSDSWAWWNALYENDIKNIYIDIASGQFKAKCIEAIEPISASLDLLSVEGKL